MSPSGESLGARLRSIYAGLDTSPGFDERVLARVRAERDDQAVARAARARAEESRRYEVTKRRQGWRGRIRRLATLDVAGATAFAGFLARAAWTGIADRAEFISMHASQSLTVLGLVLALAPLAVVLRRRSAELA